MGPPPDDQDRISSNRLQGNGYSIGQARVAAGGGMDRCLSVSSFVSILI